jgi:hypothetical protein
MKPEVADDIERRMMENLSLFSDRILPITREIADLWGELLGRTEKNVDDTGLAATARVYGLVLVTRNTRHVAGRGATRLDPFKTSPEISRRQSAGSAVTLQPDTRSALQQLCPSCSGHGRRSST